MYFKFGFSTVISAPISSSRSIAARAVTPGENGAEEVEMLVLA